MPLTDLAALLHAAGLAPQEAEEVAQHEPPYILGYLAPWCVSLRDAQRRLWTVAAWEQSRLRLEVLEQVIDLVARECAAPRAMGEPGDGGVGGD